MKITNAQYKRSSTEDGTITCIKCEIDGVVNYVPISIILGEYRLRRNNKTSKGRHTDHQGR